VPHQEFTKCCAAMAHSRLFLYGEVGEGLGERRKVKSGSYPSRRCCAARNRNLRLAAKRGQGAPSRAAAIAQTKRRCRPSAQFHSSQKAGIVCSSDEFCRAAWRGATPKARSARMHAGRTAKGINFHPESSARTIVPGRSAVVLAPS